MPYWYCKKCQKALGEKEHYRKWYETPPTTGPLIAGHIMNNPNLPIVAVPVSQSNGFFWEYCSKCHSAAVKRNTKDEEQASKIGFGIFQVLWIIFWIVVLGFLIYGLANINTPPPGGFVNQ